MEELKVIKLSDNSHIYFEMVGRENLSEQKSKLIIRDNDSSEEIHVPKEDILEFAEYIENNFTKEN